MSCLVKSKYIGTITWLRRVSAPEVNIRSQAVKTTETNFDGILGESHFGATRSSCVRVDAPGCPQPPYLIAALSPTSTRAADAPAEEAPRRCRWIFLRDPGRLVHAALQGVEGEERRGAVEHDGQAEQGVAHGC